MLLVQANQLKSIKPKGREITPSLFYLTKTYNMKNLIQKIMDNPIKQGIKIEETFKCGGCNKKVEPLKVNKNGKAKPKSD